VAAAFTAGPERTVEGGADETFAGVHPIDSAVARRPAAAQPTAAQPTARADLAAGTAGRVLDRTSTRPATATRRSSAPPRGRRPRRIRPRWAPDPRRDAARLDRVLFPDGVPDLPDRVQDTYDRMDLRFAVDVLMGNREPARRRARTGTPPPR
jgi:hypothetical protein